MSDQRNVRALAFYLPQFHPIEENDRAWGTGFTEWANVVRARPAFPGHEQPHLPADLGFYDLRVAETRIAQAELAAANGIDGFCYYHYWFAGRRVLERPFAEVLADGVPDFPFCLSWANEDWRANWDGSSGELLLGQSYSEDDDREHIAWLMEAFADPRYIRVDGRPLLLVYRAAQLPDPRRTAELWRAAVRDAGLGELLLARVESFDDERADPAGIGFDAAVEFAPDWRLLGQADPRLAPRRVHDYEGVAERMLAKPAPGWRRWRGVTARWDNSPRRPEDALVLAGSTPESYRRWLAATVDQAAAESSDGEGLVFVNAWNEWGEGAHLEPDQTWGHAYLEATAAGMAAGRRMAALPAADRAGVEVNRALFKRLEAEAEALAEAGDVPAAAAKVEEAAELAWYDHTGAFVSPRLERVVERLGRRVADGVIDERPAQDEPDGPFPRRVLHVLTEAHAVGGHTRLAWRWAEKDPGRTHTVALTAQGGRPVPEPLERVAERGGGLHVLDGAGADHVERARALRRLAAGHDLVVLHVHPFDLVPGLAFAARPGGGPRVAVLNHDDHVFWLGTAVADVVVNVHHSGTLLAMSRRGIEPARLAELPSPLGPPAPLPAAEARRALGIEPDAVVLLTIATAYKFAPAGGEVAFWDLVEPVLAAHPEALLVAVGPNDDGPWHELAQRTGGRVRLPGRQQDLRPFHAAADVYLDSFPFASMTSLLEAGLHGVPVLCYQPWGDQVGPLAADDLGAGSLLVTAPTAEAWQDELGRLISDPKRRRALGERTAVAVAAAHTDEGWTDRLEAVYERCERATPARAPRVRLLDEPIELLDTLLWRMHRDGGIAKRTAETAVEALTQPEAGGPALSVVLLATGRAEQTVRCLQSVLDTCGGLGLIDTIVVDNGSTDDTAKVLDYLRDDLRAVRNPMPVELPRAWAQGVALAEGELVVMVTDDVVLEPNWLEPVLTTFANLPSCTAVTPTLRPLVGAAVGPGGGGRTSAPTSEGAGVCIVARGAALRAGAELVARHVVASVVSMAGAA